MEANMRANIEVKDRREADAIRTGLEDPTVRAFVVTMGVLKALPSDRARRRVLEFVSDRLDEENELRESASAAGNGGQ
jgi:hypothetical protein